MEDRLKAVTVKAGTHGGYVVMEAEAGGIRILFGGDLGRTLEFLRARLAPGPLGEGSPAAPSGTSRKESAKERRAREDAERQAEHEESMRISAKVLTSLRTDAAPAPPTSAA